MMNLAQSYNPIVIKNSPVEFVLIGMDRGDFRPIVVSDNCGLDLLGFAASKSYSSKNEFEMYSTTSLLSAWRKAEDSFIHQCVELNVSALIGNDMKSSKVSFYWKGARLRSSSLEEVRRIAEISFSIIVNELNTIRSRSNSNAQSIDSDIEYGKLDGFLSWHVSPVIRTVNSFNVQIQRTRDLSRIFLTIYVFLVLATASVATAYYFIGDYSRF